MDGLEDGRWFISFWGKKAPILREETELLVSGSVYSTLDTVGFRSFLGSARPRRKGATGGAAQKTWRSRCVWRALWTSIGSILGTLDFMTWPFGTDITTVLSKLAKDFQFTLANKIMGLIVGTDISHVELVCQVFRRELLMDGYRGSSGNFTDGQREHSGGDSKIDGNR